MEVNLSKTTSVNVMEVNIKHNMYFLALKSFPENNMIDTVQTSD